MTPVIVGSGVDSLYCSVQGDLWDGLMVFFRDVRPLLTDDDRVLRFHDDEGAFLLREYGWHGYPVWLSSPNYEIFLGAATPFPPAYVQMHSPFIHTLGIEAAVAETQRVLTRTFIPGGVKLVPSRIDLYVDVQGWQPQHAEFTRFVCRGIKRTLYEDFRRVHTHGARLSGFTFGKGDVVARIYDKTLQMASTGQDWQELLWHDRNPDLPVWRIEVQLRREALVSFGLRTLDQVLDQRQSLWEYGLRWLSLRTRTKHTRLERCPEDPVWTALREATIGSPSSPLVRERIREADERRLVSGWVGYSSSIAALGDNHDQNSMVANALPLARAYLAKNGKNFNDIVTKKRARRAAGGRR